MLFTRSAEQIHLTTKNLQPLTSVTPFLPASAAVVQRRAGSPSLQSSSGCFWTNFSPSDKMQRNCGAENSCVHTQLGQILDPKYTKRSKNPSATFASLAENQDTERAACSGAPLRQPRPRPSPHPLTAPGFPRVGEQVSKGTSFLSLPAAAAGTPGKPCLNSCQLNFYWLGKAKNPRQ